MSDNDVEKSYALLDEIFDLGCTFFDSAHSYGGGQVDKILGGWMSRRGNRDKIVILGKGAHPENGIPNRVAPEYISNDILESIERMQTDHIDLFILHRDNPDLPVDSIMDCLNEHIDAGRVKAIGGSNWTHQRLQEANNYAKANGLTPFVASSAQFSLAEMVQPPWPNCISVGGPGNEEARQWYLDNDMILIPWSSLAGGFFSGRFRRDNLDTFTEYFDTTTVPAYGYEDNFKRLDRAEQLAAQKGLTIAQIAMAFVFNQELHIHGLVGCRTAQEFADNTAAMQVELTPEELAWLDLRRETIG